MTSLALRLRQPHAGCSFSHGRVLPSACGWLVSTARALRGSLCRLAGILPLVLLLSACAEEAPVRYVLPDTPGGRLCAFQCRGAFDRCVEGCKLDQRLCSVTMQGQAIKDYEAYARQQFMNKQETDLRPRDFERPELCKPSKCKKTCRASYTHCFEKCGGKTGPDGEMGPLPFEGGE